MRELRVEDALLYLDQVKVEFGDRPHIYNEFLDIMKTFKTQQIDTPGVIRRVSNLFQGNKKLVLGFNTFLPEGYKIELPSDGQGPPVAVFRAPGQTVTHILSDGPAPPPPRTHTTAAPGVPPRIETQPAPAPVPPPAGLGGPTRPDGPPHPQPQLHMAQQPMRPHAGPGVAHPHQHSPQTIPPTQQRGQPGATMIGQQPGPKPPEQSAVTGAPAAYPQRAPVPHSQPPMQMHQPQAVPRPPPSQQPMIPPDASARARAEQAARGQVPPRAVHPRQPGPMPGTVVTQPPAAPETKVPAAAAPPPRMGPGAPPHPHPQPLPGPGQHPVPMQPGAHPHAIHAQPAPPPPPAQPQQQPPLEFDHAINYVTTIKKRFASEPETYKKFLEILHTYQKEQRGIKEVLDEVSVLFADHPDLLKEFTYFLPDAVQAQAKAQLDQVARESEARKRAATSKQAIMQQAQGMQRQAQGLSRTAVPSSAATRGPPYVPPPPVKIPFGATQGRPEEREKEIAASALYGLISFEPVRPPRRNEPTPAQAAAKQGRPTSIPELPLQPNTTETSFFQRAKEHLNRKELAPDKPPGSRRHTPYTEFLKCLHLFGAGILTKDELVLLLRGLFMQGHAPKSGANAGGGGSNPSVASDAHTLLREFEEILTGRGPYADQEAAFKDKSKYGTLRGIDFDLSNCDNPTPSYYSYPSDYPQKMFLSYPGQTEQDAKVLNKNLICVNSERNSRKRYITSPEDYDGVRHRRNAYEEAMFRIEDERYEVDMAIHRNWEAMKHIEPYAEEVSALRETEEKDGQPIGRLQYKLKRNSLNSIHVNAIGRIYGEAGDEVLQHLTRNPLAVLPIVYQRLRQKDAEWRKAKASMMESWNSACEANYEGSIDYQCFAHRRELERCFTANQLIEDCKRAKFYFKNTRKWRNHPVTKDFVPNFGLRCPEAGALFFQPYVGLKLHSNAAHKDACKLLATKLRNIPGCSKVDREKLGRIWAEFMMPWFQIPAHCVLDEVRDSCRGDRSPGLVKYAPGQRVRTAFGDGSILSFTEGKPAMGSRYKVKLAYGMASIRPFAVLHALPQSDGLVFVRRDGVMEKEKIPVDAGERLFSENLGSKYQALFGTENIYILLRLYCFLVSMLTDIREFLDVPWEKKRRDPSDSYYNPMKSEDRRQDKGPKLDFAGIVSMLDKLCARQTGYKDFETFCRKVSKSKVHQMAVLPRLVDKCAEALLHVAKEDLLLHLYDYCKQKEMDPVQLRSQCLDLTPDASYRIQYDMIRRNIVFSYLPEGEELITSVAPDDDSPDEDEEHSDDEHMKDGDMDDEDAMDVEPRAPPPKRAKHK